MVPLWCVAMCSFAAITPLPLTNDPFCARQSTTEPEKAALGALQPLQSQMVTKSIYVHKQWCSDLPKKIPPELTALPCSDVAKIDIFCCTHPFKQTQR